ncbi:coiled-coil domain-containing protein 1-like [Haliotis rubra]|uniref:coiled-coil domain-containing protein 1-like n=1 Tax=Haliotis rubra TaxID=36100 RepID=UPI001EE51230|nr:coiled-coil domain-containing protein 1-like [Haliotis rubra]
MWRETIEEDAVDSVDAVGGFTCIGDDDDDDDDDDACFGDDKYGNDVDSDDDDGCDDCISLRFVVVKLMVELCPSENIGEYIWGLVDRWEDVEGDVGDAVDSVDAVGGFTCIGDDCDYDEDDDNDDDACFGDDKYGNDDDSDDDDGCDDCISLRFVVVKLMVELCPSENIGEYIWGLVDHWEDVEGDVEDAVDSVEAVGGSEIEQIKAIGWVNEILWRHLVLLMHGLVT